MAFVELHARSAFSFLRASSSPEELIGQAAHLGMSQIAVTDRDGVYGSARVHRRAEKEGLSRAIVGAELTMEDESVLPVLARTREGYQNLCRLLTRSKSGVAKGEGRVKWNELEAHVSGLIGLSGDEEGGLARAIARDDRAGALQYLNNLRRIFGKEDLAVEVHRRLLRSDRQRVPALVELAQRFALPLIASNAPCHARPDGRQLLDVFTALRNHTTLDEAGLLLEANSQRHLKTEAEMRDLFADLPETVENSGRMAERVEFTLGNLGYQFPQHRVPEGHDQASFLRERAYEGARVLYGQVLSQEVVNLLEKELKVITRLGFCGYFLMIWEIVNFCKEEGILVQGRGSAANSVVCYSLGITKADPVHYKLLFERFLSGGRHTWPDIDLDLPSGDQRERVIQEMYRRFAPYGAAMTANVITYRGRSAMREMGKALGLANDVLSRFSDLFPHGDFMHTLELEDQVQRAGLASHHPRLPALLHLNRAVYGLPRHLGQHSGGMVLCTQGLDSIVPLEPASMPGRTVVQWDKDDCEDLGIIKVDLLGLGMMAALEEVVELCGKRGRPMPLERIPPDCPQTYQMIQKADTIGVFQIESRAQQATLPRLRPKEFYDLVIEVAIIRPGPIVGKMVHPYLKRRAGKEKVDYIHPDFEPFLDRTLGVPLFQEQILQMAMKIADFTGDEADELRRAMSFHRSEERMDEVMKKLRAAMDRRQVPLNTQERVVASIKSFALYGFPESHAIGFAMLAYASSWYRVHRLAEFTVALLNNQPMGFYSSSTLVRDAKLKGMRVLPVCAVLSEWQCTVLDDVTIRLGLNQVHGLSRASAEKLLMQRQKQPWQNLEDFMLRCPLPRDERRVLARAGALNALATHRRTALWEVEKEREQDLFSVGSRLSNLTTLQSPLQPMTQLERMEADFQTVHLTVGPHPMALKRGGLSGITVARELAAGKNGQSITIAGMVICRQRPGTAKGHVFVSLEDETGIANAFVPSSLFEKERLVITQEPFLKIKGRLQIVDNVISVYALKIEPLPYEATFDSESHDFH